MANEWQEMWFFPCHFCLYQRVAITLLAESRP